MKLVKLVETIIKEKVEIKDKQKLSLVNILNEMEK